MKAPTKAYSYIRFSSAPQKKGDSLRRQTELSNRYASQHGLVIDEVLHMQDLGLSAYDGTNVEKGALGAFLLAIKEGRIPRGSYLLVESLDRLSRAQVMKALSIFTDIINAGITIVTLADEMVYSSEKLGVDPLPLIMSILVMSRAHEESLSKGRRVKAAWARKRDEIATGVKMTRTCPSWMELSEDRSKFKLIPSKVKIVKRILKMHLEGMGQSAIVNQLNREGVPALQSRITVRMGKTLEGTWHTSTIQKVVLNPALYGAYQPTVGLGNKKRVPNGDPIEHYYPALITKDEFLRIRQARLNRREARGARGKTYTNLFSGLLKCGYCGSSMNLAGHTPKNKPPTHYIVCSRAKRGVGCHHIMWQYHLFEKSVLAFCDTIDFATLLDDSGQKGRAIQAELVDTLRGRRQDLVSKLEKLVVAIEDGNSPVAIVKRIGTLERQIDSLDRELTEAEFQLTKLRATRQDASTIKASVIDLVKQFETKKGDQLYLLRANVAAQIRRVVTEIRVYPGGYMWTEEFYEEFIRENDMTDADVERENLREMKGVNRELRFAEIYGMNGKVQTWSRKSSEFFNFTEKADLLKKLNVSH